MSSRLGRLGAYLWDMFPLHLMVPVSIAKFYAFYFVLHAFGSDGPIPVTMVSMLGALTFTLGLLIARVYDELKDAPADIRLAAAGDPRYMDRPIVTGAVKLEDLQSFRWLITLLAIGLNVVVPPTMMVGFVFMFGVLWLSYKWFFWPAIQKSLFLALITHNPLVVVLQIYIISAFVAEFDGSALGVWTLVLMLGLWFPMTAWEISRKQRIPEDETDYETYTKVFGFKRAPWVAAFFVAASTACMLAVWSHVGLPIGYPIVLGLGALLAIGSYMRFYFTPSTETSKLQPPTEAFVMAAEVGLVVTFWVDRGVSWV